MTLEELKRLAAAATPGEWACDRRIGTIDVPSQASYCNCTMSSDDAEFIAAFNPETAKRLIAVVEAAEQVKRSFMAINDGFHTGLVPPEFAPLLEPLAALSPGEPKGDGG